MKNITITTSLLTGVTLIASGLIIEIEWLAIAALISGGIFLGHAMTEALNDPTE